MTTGWRTPVELAPPEEAPPIAPSEPPSPSADSDRARVGAIAVVVAAILAVTVALSATLDLQYAGRGPLAVLFVITVPGVPVVALLKIPDRLLQLSLTIAFSLSATILTSSTLLVSKHWHPIAGLWVLTGICLAVTPLALKPRITLARKSTRSLPRYLSATFRAGLSGPRLVGLVILVLAESLLAFAVHQINIDAANSVGLISVVGWPYFACLILVMAVVAYALISRRVDNLLLFVASVVLIFAFYEVASLAESRAVVPVSWLHVGFIRYISEHGAVPHSFDARFSWPGFFAAGAQLVKAAGYKDAAPLTLLAPAFYNILVLPSLFVIGRCITRSSRLTWLGVIIYLCSNWWQQDYLSPQATALLIFLAIIATLLWLATASRGVKPSGHLISRLLAAPRSSPSRPAGLSRSGAVGLGLMFAVFAAAIVVSHQLTPVSLIIALLIFTFTGSTRYRSLWVAVTMIFIGWFSYGATDYWYGHLATVVGGVGQVGSTVNSSVGGRLAGATGLYANSQYVRIAWSAGLFMVAALGALLIRKRRGTFLIVSLALAPFSLVLLQSYGGEVVIRSFVYAGPFLAPLAALSLRRLVSVGQWTRVRGVILLLLLVPGGLVLTYTRGLNVSFERNPSDQIAASDFIFSELKPGDTIGLPLGLGLDGTQKISLFGVSDLTDVACGQAPPACAMTRPPRFVLFDITQDAQGQLQYGQPKGWLQALTAKTLATGLYTPVFRTQHTEVLELKKVPTP